MNLSPGDSSKARMCFFNSNVSLSHSALMVFVSEVCLPILHLKGKLQLGRLIFFFFFKVVNGDLSLSKPMARSQEHLKPRSLGLVS